MIQNSATGGRGILVECDIGQAGVAVVIAIHAPAFKGRVFCKRHVDQGRIAGSLVGNPASIDFRVVGVEKHLVEDWITGIKISHAAAPPVTDVFAKNDFIKHRAAIVVVHSSPARDVAIDLVHGKLDL